MTSSRMVIEAVMVVSFGCSLWSSLLVQLCGHYLHFVSVAYIRINVLPPVFSLVNTMTWVHIIFNLIKTTAFNLTTVLCPYGVHLNLYRKTSSTTFILIGGSFVHCYSPYLWMFNFVVNSILGFETRTKTSFYCIPFHMRTIGTCCHVEGLHFTHVLWKGLYIVHTIPVNGNVNINNGTYTRATGIRSSCSTITPLTSYIWHLPKFQW